MSARSLFPDMDIGKKAEEPKEVHEPQDHGNDYYGIQY